MATTGTWSTGSVQDYIGAVIGWSNIPTTISGTILNNMINQEINFANEYIPDTITSTTIQEKYQPSIIDLTFSKILPSIDMNQGGFNNIRIGEFSVTPENNTKISKQLRDDAILRLKELKKTILFKRVIS